MRLRIAAFLAVGAMIYAGNRSQQKQCERDIAAI
jgi:hypothetical protein